MTDGRDRLLAEREVRQDCVSGTASAALHGLLDAPGDPPRPGEALPPLWHWLAFLPDQAQRFLGADGHPMVGSFIPEERPPRRMFAGGRIAFAGDLVVGRTIKRSSRATSVTSKEGKTGSLLFVEVTHDLRTEGGGVVTDTQDIVYRQADTAPSPSSEQLPAPSPSSEQLPAPAPVERPDATWSIELLPTPTLLFRFSALTYNAHRIHYDRPYATGTEGYPGLVVHGPLQAIGLAEVVRRHLPSRRIASFTFRARQPAFDGSPILLCGRLAEVDTVELQAVSGASGTTMTATATLTPPID